MQTNLQTLLPNGRRDLGNGLVLRWSNASDTEALAQLGGQVFRNREQDPPNMSISTLVRDLMSGHHPLMGPNDYVVVEDTQRKELPLIACTCFLTITWEYEGMPFRVGRPEIVATDPAYRNRGLIRALFELIHARSHVEGDMAQAITGIPYFYRQFDYEYALDLGGRRFTYLPLVPAAKEGEPEPYTLRDATLEDIPLIQTFYERSRRNSIVFTHIDEGWWRYQVSQWETHRAEGASWQANRTEESWHIQMIVDATGVVQGSLVTLPVRWDGHMFVWDLEIGPGANLQAIVPSLLRALRSQAVELPAMPDAGPLTGIAFNLGQVHPLYDVLGQALAPRYQPPYAWYVRVPDLPRFLRYIAPVLERRLAESSLAGYSGELRLDFYRSGLCLAFDKGTLAAVENWRKPVWEPGEHASFPPLVFLQTLFGYRSLDELRHAFPDVRVKDEAEAVLKVLFPARPSRVIPIA